MGSPKRPLMDPATRDWVLVNGSRRADETHTSEVLFLLDLQRSSAVAYPDLGSTFHEITKVLPNTPKAVELAAASALAPLSDDRRILDVTPSASDAGQGKVKLDLEWRDSRSRSNENKLRITVGGGT